MKFNVNKLSFTYKNCLVCGNKIFTKKFKRYCNDCLKLKFKSKEKNN